MRYYGDHEAMYSSLTNKSVNSIMPSKSLPKQPEIPIRIMSSEETLLSQLVEGQNKTNALLYEILMSLKGQSHP